MNRPSRTLASLFNVGGNAGNKLAFHRHARKFLEDLRWELGLFENKTDLRSNFGGPIVSGEVTLHADTIYIQMYESGLQPGITILYRTCKSRSDYTGGVNHFVPLKVLYASQEKRDLFVSHLRQLMTPVELLT